jgi:hypothetical protein
MTGPEYTKARRERLKASGICVDCARTEAIKTAQRCQECNEKQLKRKRMARPDCIAGREDGAPTLREIAEEMGISAPRVQQLLTSALRKVRLECLRRGIDASWIIGTPLSRLAEAEDS